MPLAALLLLLPFCALAQDVSDLEPKAARGDAKAQYELGALYLRGKAVEQNDHRAFEWFSKSAELGYAPAQDRLGGMYLTGLAVSKDEALAKRWLLKAAKQGYARAQRNLGRLLEPSDEARAWYEKAAAQGDAESQFRLGDHEKAAEGGHAEAQFVLAERLHGEGSVLPALAWLRKAAGSGYGPAQARLAELSQDPAEAWTWWLTAAETGDAGARYRVGEAYRLGLLGQAQDDDRARLWHERAAEQGQARSAYALAQMGGEEAGGWLKKAAFQGLAEAQRGLGQSLLEGDRVQACSWLGLAAEQGDAEAKKAFDELKGSLTGEELMRVLSLMKRDRSVPK